MQSEKAAEEADVTVARIERADRIFRPTAAERKARFRHHQRERHIKPGRTQIPSEYASKRFYCLNSRKAFLYTTFTMKTQSEDVYAELRRRILILEIRPEERLKEEYWASRLQVSRPAVREALTRLHGEGLVVKGAKGGYFVAPMSPNDVHEIRQVREIIEVAALELASKRATKKELDQLEETCDDFADMVRKGYHTGACEADRKFHELLIEASGNRKLVQAYQYCHIPLFHLRLGQSREYMDDYADTESEHRKIVKELRAKNASKAIATLRAHFQRGERAVLNHL